MKGVRQSWLVAKREIRERSRSRAFIASVVIMIIVVVGVIALPALLDSSGTKTVGFAGTTPPHLTTALQSQGEAVGTKIRTRSYDTIAAGEQAVRDGKISLLVVDGSRLEWQRRADEQLKAVATGAIQILAVQQRAAAAGISTNDLTALLAPAEVTSVELGQVAGRSPDDETATFIITVLLFMAISTYGAMVLSGVVEEKSSRVVEVLLARIPARNLLAGKIAGIGLLGLAQIAATALAALIAVTTINSVDLPAVRGGVLAWAVVWFILGYALYATLFGALGSLASRPEDAQSTAGPVSVGLVLVYFVSFAAIGSADTTWARMVAWFPASAPIAMPSRIAMGAASWWDPLVALALTGATIAGLVVLGGRVYAGAVLHNGPTLKLRDVWHQASIGPTSTASDETSRTIDLTSTTAAPSASNRQRAVEVIAGIAAIAIGALTFAVTSDFIIGVAAGAATFAVATWVAKLWRGPTPRTPGADPTASDNTDTPFGDRDRAVHGTRR
jgi:ABC-2 type transport system permease protein